MLLEGKKVAESVYEKLLLEISLLPQVPKLVVILVGEDPASQTYVKSKTRRCLDLGVRGELKTFPASFPEEALIQEIRRLNEDSEVNGILVQLPLPKAISKEKVLREISPLKDVDGLHSENVGLLFQGHPRFIPCTPAGVIDILNYYRIPIAGRRAVVIGRSEIVGKPMAQLLLMNDATVTICHSKTPALKQVTAEADILVAALGRPKFVDASFVKPGATVIDVGIHRTPEGIVGDVDFASVSPIAGAITPVPGGVGVMTIARLMANLVHSAKVV